MVNIVNKNQPRIPSITEKYFANPFSGRLPKPTTTKQFRLIDPDWAQNWATNLEGSGFTGPTVDYIQDAGWIRMKELTVSYSFNKLLKDSFVDNLEIYFTGRNLFLSTPYTGIDPNTSLLGAGNAQGMDYFDMPGTKTYLLGLRFAF